MIREMNIDVWKYLDLAEDYVDAFVCPTNMVVKSNGSLVMGAGIALDVAKRHPWMVAHFGAATNYIQKYTHAKSNIVVAPTNDGALSYKYVVALPTKYHYKDKSDLELIELSIYQLLVVANAIDWSDIVMTRPGCGLGGLNWEKQVKPILEEFLDDRFLVCHKE